LHALILGERVVYPFTVVDMFETDKDVREGKRRRPYPELGVVYFFREDEDERSVSLICRDFEDDVRVDNRDIFEKCFPCIFKGIPPVSPVDGEGVW
jgi:hypothetical protein